ncbi:hypothetical protein BKA93DRAFT_793154 [Sparassis latifolia]
MVALLHTRAILLYPPLIPIHPCHSLHPVCRNNGPKLTALLHQPRNQQLHREFRMTCLFLLCTAKGRFMPGAMPPTPGSCSARRA